MKFWKMNGAGNDFIIINNLEEHIPLEAFGRLAKRLCERHLSIGADGLMAVTRAEAGGDYRMLFFNADGSMGEMCGNGARCICRYGFENGLAGEVQRVETTAGLVVGERISKRQYRVRLNEPTICRLDEAVEIDGETLHCAYVELGNPGLPHCVVEIPDLRTYPDGKLAALGRKLRHYPGFPKGANVNFFALTGEDQLDERTFERGVEDFTYACGTGTGSVVLVLTLQGRVSGKDVKVDMQGGRLVIDIVRGDDAAAEIFLTGPTNIVAKGEIFDEEL